MGAIVNKGIMLKVYLQELYKVAGQGDAREESFYSALGKLLNDYAKSINKKNMHVTTLPKKTEGGNPDFRVWDGAQHIIGYIEAKAPSIKNLDEIEETPQLQRYISTFPNLILTNFCEFRLYRNGNIIDKVIIAKSFIITKLKTVPPAENEHDFFELFDKYFSFSLPQIYDAKSLARELAKRTSFLRDEVISFELAREEAKEKRMLLGFYEAFRRYLIGGLSKQDFADLYSQTVTYGLFAARTRCHNGFNRKLAYDLIPHTIGILRDVFKFISFEDIPRSMEWIIDDISEVLEVTDVNKLLHQYFHQGKGGDPIIHFYETFLSEYDPATREKRGVYYTPAPVVSFIVRSLNDILKKYFERQDGFADKTVTVLDPAAGTLTFIAEAAKITVDEFKNKYGDGGVETLIKEHILEKFYGFELMMAPYAIGHLKISFLLEELGYKLQPNDRFKLYLTNTLEMENLAQTEIPGIGSLSEESHLAGEVKKEKPILVIMGNPPYSGHSANASIKTIKEYINGKERQKKIKTWIGRLIEDYKYVDGKPLGERNPKWLQDDYVKFIRFAQWKIDQHGEGVLGFITNHSFLDSPTFRGMRQSLMHSFNEIYVLDLHGNSLKREKCPDGSKDENVFDIQQGVAISLFIKQKDNKKKCKLYHSEMWGTRSNKYDLLKDNNIATIKWNKLKSIPDYYLFTPRDDGLLKRYNEYPKINDIFPVNSIGIVTSRDKFVIDFEKSDLIKRMKLFLNKQIPDDIIRQTYGLKDTSNWNLATARQKLRSAKNWEESIRQVLYRPFDTRWIIYDDAMIERTRKDVMEHMIFDNLGILVCRQQNKSGFKHAFISDTFVESCVISNRTREINYLFPLYVYNNNFNNDLFAHSKKTVHKSKNIDSGFLNLILKIYKNAFLPEHIFFYCYSILFSNKYRLKYASFLKTDFPRIPFTCNYELFKKMSGYGKTLTDLHLLRSSVLGPSKTKFVGKHDNGVEKISYSEAEKRVYINSRQCFNNIESDLWQYKIGGYMVCEKWLKERKGRKLSLDEIKHFCKVVTAIQGTIETQNKIDELFMEVEKDIINFNL